jgi:hypothetical protein
MAYRAPSSSTGGGQVPVKDTFQPNITPVLRGVRSLFARRLRAIGAATSTPAAA